MDGPEVAASEKNRDEDDPDASAKYGGNEYGPEVDATAEPKNGREEDNLEVDASSKDGRDKDGPDVEASAERGREEYDPDVDAPTKRDLEDDDPKVDVCPENGLEEDDREVDAPAEEEKIWTPRTTRTGMRLLTLIQVSSLPTLIPPVNFSMTVERAWMACRELTIFWFVKTFARFVIRTVVNFFKKDTFN